MNQFENFRFGLIRLSIHSTLEVYTIMMETLKEIKAKGEEFHSLVAPHAVPMTDKERKSTAAIGEKGYRFAVKTTAHAKSNGDLIPPLMSLSQLEADIAEADELMPIINLLKQDLRALEDLSLIRRRRAYKYSLHFYNYVCVMAKSGMTRAKAIYDDLRVRFARKSPGPSAAGLIAE
jgi:hypothetical protein